MLGPVRRPGFSKTARSHVRHREARRQRLHLRARPIHARGHPDDLSESAAEGAQAREADVEADVRDGALGLGKLEHRPLDPTALKVSVWGLAKGPAEGPYEMSLRHVRHLSEVCDVERLGEGAVDCIARSEHTAVELLDRPAHPGQCARRGLLEEPLRRHSAIGALDDDADLFPVDLDVEVDANPAAVSNVRRPKETLRFSFHKNFLGALRRGAPSAQAIVVLVVRGGDELPARDEPRRLAMAHLLGHLRKGETDLPKPLDFDRIARSLPRVHKNSCTISAIASTCSKRRACVAFKVSTRTLAWFAARA